MTGHQKLAGHDRTTVSTLPGYPLLLHVNPPALILLVSDEPLPRR